MFSPDGNQLVFSNNTEFFVYNLTTKATTALNFNEDNGPNIITWTTDGILSFHHQFESIMARNETNGMIIGEWKSAEGLYGSTISPSAKHIITRNLIVCKKITRQAIASTESLSTQLWISIPMCEVPMAIHHHQLHLSNRILSR